MNHEFQKSLIYSTLFHGLLLLLLFLLYHSFLVARTPLMMELTLIGQMSQGQGLGSPASHSGEVPVQLPMAETNGEFSTPKTELANPPVAPAPHPDVSVKKPLKPKVHSGAADSEAYLESLQHSAPIGLELKKDAPDKIKTTAGLGHIGVAGTPNGNTNIEGELAARTIKWQVKPDYPDWAKKQGIEATVRLQLTVLPNGFLKESEIQFEQTSGYRELDENVYKALIQWQFEPLPPEIPQVDQTGVITFSFSLKNNP